MLLKDYLTGCDGFSRGGKVLKNGECLKKLAEDVGCSTRHLYQVAMGTRRASWLLASHVERLTGGKVSIGDMLPEHKEVKRRKR